MMSEEGFRALIERSSLGTDAARAARESVSDEQAAAIVARANGLSGGYPDYWCHICNAGLEGCLHAPAPLPPDASLEES